jgi:glycine cleavage system aminomethyltransferase T
LAEKEVGEITSAVSVPAGEGDQTLAMGYVRTEAQAPGTEVSIDGRKAKVSDMPFRQALQIGK